MNIQSFPTRLKIHFGVDFTKILVRSCFEELYEEITAEMLSPTSKISGVGFVAKQTFLVTGVTGVGKTMFMVYFLCRYSRDDRFADKRFAAEFRSTIYNYYSPADEAGKYNFTDQMDTDLLEDILLVVDMPQIAVPPYYGKYTLIFGRPNPSRIILAYQYTLPTWTESELCLVDPNIGSWYDRFVLFGGVARIVLGNGDLLEKLNRTIQIRGVSVATEFLSDGFPFDDSELSYLLIHMNPPRSDDGRFMYSAKKLVYTFASDYIFRELCTLHRTVLLSDASALFRAGVDFACDKLGDGSAGNLFEKLCLWLAPVAGRTITCQALETNINPLVIEIPSYQILKREWKEEQSLISGVLYQPAISNMEFGNAFCVLLLNGECVLIVLQITVAAMHPIKASGLKHIYRAFTESIRKQIQRKLIIFVTPFDGKLKAKQRIYSQGDQDIPEEAKYFEQWVYRHGVVA